MTGVVSMAIKALALLALFGAAVASHAAAGDEADEKKSGKTGTVYVQPEGGPEPPGNRVITPASEQRTSSTSRPHSGPSIELITGGNSTDGAAHVGRLPVVD